MNIALLGYGKEGKAAEKYFKSHFKDVSFDIFENFTLDEIANKDYSSYDIILRSPSVPPLTIFRKDLPNISENKAKFSSMTRYFFDHCPCPIIGVTATKGKGTTCSFIKSLLDAEGFDTYLVGNIGNPSIEALDNLTENSVVVYEMSSFQLWDMEKSPVVAVVGTIEPDHLNVHDGMEDYLNAKANIGRFQSPNDSMVYYKNNPDSIKIAEKSPAKKFPYPRDDVPEDILNSITIPGRHNRDNAVAALTAVSAFLNISWDEYLSGHKTKIKEGLKNFKGLPHRLEFLRELNGVKYYDDNFSTNPASTRVAIEAFPDDNLVMIVGGRDKTDNADLPEIYEILKSDNIKKIILLGESGHELAKRYADPRFIITESLQEAVKTAKQEAEKLSPSLVLMSPSAASFDMFKDVYDRGDQFKNLISTLS
ncbi:UDP-N-acetylmuramoyl-L-alanine--D-glutamate ligase [Candidatus Saccharibacteria bacterium]|nr:UDP-N-acetylmuramoyl-L-alanine--D-glutamate ligase [Candidatus Saccharibacteria bacterium]